MPVSATIPDSELVWLENWAAKQDNCFDTHQLRKSYQDCGIDLIPDALDQRIGEGIIAALQARRGFSAIRVSDAEANILSFGMYPETPELNAFGCKAAIAQNLHRFNADETWLMVMRQWMLGSIAQADIVGVRGLWLPGYEVIDRTEQIPRIRSDHRGLPGHLRAIAIMLQMAKEGHLKGKRIGSVHFYFAVIEMLDKIIAAASRVLVMTDDPAITPALQLSYPEKEFDSMLFSKNIDADTAEKPDFLRHTLDSLPGDLRGCLVLVGAGLWADFYCSVIKQRGGVAVDLGSGFHILSGSITRPIHHCVDADRLKKMKLTHYKF